jgi:glutathione peroxidase
MEQNIFSIALNDIKGRPIDWVSYQGKKLMIVNVASECGYTAQYTQLEALYKQYEDKLVILGCPCNDFGGQEPGNEEQIQAFCNLNFGVSFPLTQKIKILGNPHPLYAWLTSEKQNGVGDFEVKWNFHKFLVNADGSLFKSFSSGVEPMDDVILDWLNS